MTSRKEMNLTTLLGNIEHQLKYWILKKKTGKLTFIITFNEGGIRDAPLILREEKLK